MLKANAASDADGDCGSKTDTATDKNPQEVCFDDVIFKHKRKIKLISIIIVIWPNIFTND